MSSLVLREVSRDFGGVHAVRQVSLRVPYGSVTGLIGPNGAGKSTLVNLVTGILALSGGEIRVGDKDISRCAAHEIAACGVARTFQNIRLMKEATVLENIMVGLHTQERASIWSGLLGLPSSRRERMRLEARGLEIAALFSIDQYVHHPAGLLSYGHQRRVEMARAVAVQPKVLLLDEPVAGMNDLEAMEVGKLFSDLAATGIAVLLIEHNIRFVSAYCEEIYVLDAGQVISEGAPRKVLADPPVIAAYLGEEEAIA